jgi:hypothetical protein
MTHTANMNIDVSRPLVPASRLSIRFAGIVIAFSLLLWLTVCFQTLFVVPRFDRLFDEFRMSLPWITELVTRHSWWLAPGLIAASILACTLVRFRWVWIMVLLVLPTIVNLTMIASLYFPYIELMGGLAGGKK